MLRDRASRHASASAVHSDATSRCAPRRGGVVEIGMIPVLDFVIVVRSHRSGMRTRSASTSSTGAGETTNRSRGWKSWGIVAIEKPWHASTLRSANPSNDGAGADRRPLRNACSSLKKAARIVGIASIFVHVLRIRNVCTLCDRGS